MSWPDVASPKRADELAAAAHGQRGGLHLRPGRFLAEPLANRVFPSLDELEEVQAERCRWLQAHPQIVQVQTCFHWWPFLVDST